MLRKMERVLSPARTQVCYDTQHIMCNGSIPADHSAFSSAHSQKISGCPDIQSSLFSPIGNNADCRQAPVVPLQARPASERGRGPDRDRSEMRYEEYGRDYYPIEHMQKLAGMYVVPIESLLDDYNLFLYHDQGRQIRERRLSKKLTQKAYAANLGVSLDKLKKWEENRVRMFKSTWEKYFR